MQATHQYRIADTDSPSYYTLTHEQKYSITLETYLYFQFTVITHLSKWKYTCFIKANDNIR